MKLVKHITLMLMFSFIIAQNEREITDGCELPDSNEMGYLHLTADGDVLYKTPAAIGGWQFSVDGATVISASGGHTGANG